MIALGDLDATKCRTLLVDQWLPEVRDILSEFDFLPSWHLAYSPDQHDEAISKLYVNGEILETTTELGNL